ncbi:hypothetical protein TYRP_001636 [Tyrophagus putrescentiae]|nr:hypothetical protein TYRP_001636 [Tyrophagus putrescentiae]
MDANVTDSSESTCYVTPTLEPISDKKVQLFIFLLYLTTSVISVVGNVIVILVQFFGNESSRSIRKYLNNLAISDITLSVMSMPFTYTNIVKGHWSNLPHWLCPLAQYVQLLCPFITSSTLAIIGIERFLVTLHPLSPLSDWFKSKSNYLLALFWFIGAVYAAIPVENTLANEFEFNGEKYYQCSYDNNISQLKLKLFVGFNFLLTFLIPAAIMSFAYFSIMRKLKTKTTFVAVYSNNYPERCTWIYRNDVPLNVRSLLAVEKRSKTIQMMFIVLLMYCLSWFPVKLFQLLGNYQLISYCSEGQFFTLIYSFIAFHWLAMANSFVNPIIYSYMSISFRF